MNKLSLWRQPEYLKFYSSFFLGNVGDWFDFFALQIIFAHNFDVTANGIVYMLCAYILPMILLASVAGSAADKFNKKWLLLLTDVIAGVFTVALIFAPNMMTALVLIAVRSCFVAFNSPAQQATSKLLLPDELQLKASSYEKVAFQLCRIIGPMLGAVVVAISSPKACLAINAGSFFLSSFILVFLKPLKEDLAAKQQDEKEEVLKESNFKLTLRLIKQSQLLKFLVPLILLGSLFIMMVELQLVILLRDLIPTRPNLLGYVIGFSALGSVLSAVWLSRKQGIKQFGWYMVLCYFCVAIGYGFMGIYQVNWPIVFFFAASLLSGFGLGIVFVLQTYAIKKEVHGKKIGRVTGVLSILQGIAYAVGVGFGGDLITAVGAREAFLAVGIACLVFGVLTVLLSRKLRAA